jgi:hypothetical protein
LEWPGVRGLPVLLLLLALPLPGAAQPAQHGYDFFPREETFRGLLADPAEPRVFMSHLRVKRDAGDGSAAAFSAAFLGVGFDFGLLRRSGAAPGEGWQLGVFGSADSLFNLDLPGDALMNTDYRFGMPLSWRTRSVSLRARLYHQSSHLGDELIIGGNAPRRVDLSFEAADLLAAWEYGGWRLYGGASQVLRTRTRTYDGGGLHAGFDYVGPAVIFGQRLVAGLDVKWLEAADWGSGVSAKAGMRFGGHGPRQRALTVLLETYQGFAPFGQFFVEDLRYYGATLQFEF